MGRLQDIYVKRTVDYLAREGSRIAQKAYATKDTLDDTLNQADAFGYIVFYDGVARKRGYALPTGMASETHKGWDKMGVKEGTGREWLDEFMETWKPKGKGFVLVVVNAAFYSLIQEKGEGTLTKKYRIISQIASDMKDLQGKFKGSELTGHNIDIG